MVETGHIQLRTNIHRDLAVRLASDMQRMYEVLTRYALPCAPNRDKDKVLVTVLPVSQFEQYAQNGAGGFYRRAGLTWRADDDGQIVLPDDLSSVSKQRFQHELIHRLVEACFVRTPAWLNEGLAGFFETMAVESDKVMLGRPPYAITDRFGLGAPWSGMVKGQRILIVPMSTLPSIESMFSLASLRTRHDQAETIPRYAAAWALVHFLMLGAPDLAPRFEAYLKGLQTRGGTPQKSFAKLFEDVPLQDRLNAYLSRGEFGLLRSRPSAVETHQAPPSPRVLEMQEEEGHLHLAWLDAGLRDEQGRERFRLHLAAAKQNPRTRDAAYLVATYALLADDDLAGADRELQDGRRGAPDNAAFLAAHLDILLVRKAPVAELKLAAERLQPLATTAGQFCSLAKAALRMEDRTAALELSERGLQLNPRLLSCRIARTAEVAPP